MESLIKKNTVKDQNSIAEHGLCAEEEIYFDPRPCLESDCEDFFSVSGDLTSCDNTPIQQSSFKEISQFPLYTDGPSSCSLESSPAVMKKQLIEFFQESFKSNASIDCSQNLGGRSKANPSTCHLPPKSTNKSFYERVANSACSGETTPVINYKTGKGKFAKSAPCCLPNIVRSLSFSGRKKRLHFRHGSSA
ncbi:hypothetical protein CJ030_MR5G025806 [Morella rubra]|uniref:Uncharacterized protein n=1 Tax=Morella rubra TaxID=262757 RepID=A0A6A1VK64_9ROSI|nr:hypothetical protein CJ030_MR5G025806 [Morella rubra]